MNDRQTAGPGEIFLDHVGWFVADMDRAAAAFGAMGFPLTPYSVHGDRDPATGERRLVGSANRLAMLGTGYLEILTPVDGVDSPVARHMRAALGRYTGVHLAAFNVADAEAEAEAVRARGIPVMPTTHLRRDVETPDGGIAEAAFTVIRAELGHIPEGRLQSVTHHTPEHVWQARHIAANGVDALTGVVWTSPDPAASADRLAAYAGRPATAIEGGAAVLLDRGRLDVLDPAAARARFGDALADLPGDAPAIAAIAFAGDPARFARHLTDAGIAHRTAGDSVTVPAAAALGAALVLSPAP